jgi:hypothetical protein
LVCDAGLAVLLKGDMAAGEFLVFWSMDGGFNLRFVNLLSNLMLSLVDMLRVALQGLRYVEVVILVFVCWKTEVKSVKHRLGKEQ